MRVCSHCVRAAGLLACLAAVAVLPGDDAAPAAPDLGKLVENAAGIDPKGRPNNYSLGDLARYFIWHDSDGWHLRVTAPRGKSSGFRGTLKLHGAKFLSVRPVGLDKKEDSAALSPGKDEVTFKFVAGAKFDGFDFNLEAEDDAKIAFDLLVGGRRQKDRIVIGRKAANPKGAQFALPAKP